MEPQKIFFISAIQNVVLGLVSLTPVVYAFLAEMEGLTRSANIFVSLNSTLKIPPFVMECLVGLITIIVFVCPIVVSRWLPKPKLIIPLFELANKRSTTGKKYFTAKSSMAMSHIPTTIPVFFVSILQNFSVGTMCAMMVFFVRILLIINNNLDEICFGVLNIEPLCETLYSVCIMCDIAWILQYIFHRITMWLADAKYQPNVSKESFTTSKFAALAIAIENPKFSHKRTFIDEYGRLNVVYVFEMLAKRKSSQNLFSKNGKLIERSEDVLQRTVDEDKREQLANRLKNAQMNLMIGGKCEKRLLSDICPKFMRDNYPNLHHDHCYWNLSFEGGMVSKHSHKMKNSEYHCLGQKAEEYVFNKINAMLHQKTMMPSFVIGRYQYNRYLAQYLQICKNSGITFKNGDIDLLVCLSGSVFFVIEVKATSECDLFKTRKGGKITAYKCEENKLHYALREQCERAVKMLVTVNCDLFRNKNVVFIKVLALPNCLRASFCKQFCPECLSHIMCKEDLGSTGSLHKWFKNILEYNYIKPTSRHDKLLYECVIGRLLAQAII